MSARPCTRACATPVAVNGRTLNRRTAAELSNGDRFYQSEWPRGAAEAHRSAARSVGPVRAVCAGRQYFEQVKAAEALKDEDFIVDDEGEDFEDLLFARLQTGEFGGSSEEDDDDDFVPVSSG